MSIDPDKLHIIPSKPKHNSHADAILHFEGDYECLSNTYKCPVSVRGEAEPYPSVEHALQASKTDDAELKATIRQAKNAIEAKKNARVIKPTPEWRARSESILEVLLRDKFRRNVKAREVLLGTGRVRLVYTNSHDDRVWGMCGGRGDNKLGKLLERVRMDVLAGKDTELWCATRLQLPTPLDVAVNMAVTKEGRLVAEPLLEGRPVIRMGKLVDNDIVMAHPSVSRFHALLVIDKTLGAHLVDLGTSNGSFVNGRRLAPFVPEPIKAGGETLTFAKSKRSYTLTKVEADLREAKKRRLYASMSDPTASAAEPDPDSTIYVGNLDHSVAEDDLREFFSECGSIASIRIPQEKDTGKMRGIAFVAFTKHSGVLHALTLEGDDLKGKGVKIRRAESRSEHKPPGKANSDLRTAGADNKAAGVRGDRNREENAVRERHGSGVDPAAKATLEVVARAAIMRLTEASRTKAAVAESGGGEDSFAAKRRKVRDKDEPSAGGDQQRKYHGRWGDYEGEDADASTIKTESQHGGGGRDRNGDGSLYDVCDGGGRRRDDDQKRRHDVVRHGSRKSPYVDEDTLLRSSLDRRSSDCFQRRHIRDSESPPKACRGDKRARPMTGNSSKHDNRHRDRRDRKEEYDRTRNEREGGRRDDDGRDRHTRDDKDRRRRRTEQSRGRHSDLRDGDEAHERRYSENQGDMGRMRNHDSRDGERGGQPRRRSRSRSRDRW